MLVILLRFEHSGLSPCDDIQELGVSVRSYTNSLESWLTIFEGICAGQYVTNKMAITVAYCTSMNIN